MRRLIVCALVALAVMGSAAAQQPAVGLEPLLSPGNIAITAGVGYGFLWGAVDLSAGVELLVARFDLGSLPLTVGVAGRAQYYRYNWGTDYHWTYIGGGALGMVHLGWRDLHLSADMGWLNNVDSYAGIGVGFYTYDYSQLSEYNEFRVRVVTVAGVSYFFTPRFALNFEGGYYGGWGGGLVGVLFKI